VGPLGRGVLALSQFNVGSSLFRPPPPILQVNFMGGGQNLPVKLGGGRNNEKPKFTGTELGVRLPGAVQGIFGPILTDVPLPYP
jgi:hypothetical protein